MTKFNDGDYIPLNWDGPPDAYYIKGHVSDEDGKDILLNEVGLIEELGSAEYLYGRWSMESCDNDNGYGHALREYTKPGRGRFKITRFGVGIFAHPRIDKNTVSKHVEEN